MSKAAARVENWRGEIIASGSVDEMAAWVRGYRWARDDSETAVRMVSNGGGTVVFRITDWPRG